MKKILKILPVVLMLCVAFNMVLGDALIDNTDASLGMNQMDADEVPAGIRNTAKNIWATVVVIVQILSVCCIVFAGVRYMLASADQKADIKQGLIYLTIGAVLVFGATLVINLVADAGVDIMTPSAPSPDAVDDWEGPMWQRAPIGE